MMYCKIVLQLSYFKNFSFSRVLYGMKQVAIIFDSLNFFKGTHIISTDWVEVQLQMARYDNLLQSENSVILKLNHQTS